MAKRKKKKGQQNQKKLKPANYVRKFGRSLPIKACYIMNDWEEQGMAQITVVREKRNGSFVLGLFLVDTFCLGLKNTYYWVDIPSHELDETLGKVYRGDENYSEIDSTTAQNIIYGAIEYAEDLGFSPNKDFRVTEYLLEDVDDLDYIEIDFGKDGQPFFFAGPSDNIHRIFRLLDKNVGKGNYRFMIQPDHPSFSDFDFDDDDVYSDDDDDDDDDDDSIDFEEL